MGISVQRRGGEMSSPTRPFGTLNAPRTAVNALFGLPVTKMLPLGGGNAALDNAKLGAYDDWAFGGKCGCCHDDFR